MGNHLAELLADRNQRTVWVDAWDYCRQLFLAGRPVDWSKRQELDEFARKSDALLHSQVFTVPLGPFLEHALANIPGLKDDMGAKSRTGYALKCMLRDAEVRRQIQQALQIIADALPHKSLVLSLPAPRHCIEWAYQQAHGRAPEAMSVEHADSASVYLSDFITALGHNRLDGVLVEEVCADDGAWAQEAEIYVPLRNVTRHQQWQLGVRLDFTPSPEGDFSSFDFVIARDGRWLDETYWAGGDVQPADGLSYGVVPADAQPETVLAQRKALGGY